MDEKWDQSELLLRAVSGDRYARESLVENNLGLVRSAVKKFVYSGCESEDLFQIGCIGLMKAVTKFDPSYNVRFSTYAVPMIIGEIRRFLRDDGIIKVSRAAKELAIKAKMVSETIEKQTGSPPTVHQLAAMLGRDSEEVAGALEAVSVPESIYKDEQKDTMSVLEKTAASMTGETELIDRIALCEAIGELGARERKIIVLRYFKHKTQSDVAKLLGISQVQVSRLEKKILNNMREILLA